MIDERLDRRALLRTLGSLASAAVVSGCMRRPNRPVGIPGAAQAVPASRIITLNGARLHYLDWGNDGGRPLVLLHAGFLNAHAWDGFARAMAPHFHVIAPDARGHGESGWNPPYSGDVFVEDLHALVRKLGLERLVLCGNSMGGSTAITFASLHPDEVERLILVDTGRARS
jgi:pimeloyl-ACP methyl ester carboxylesterase